MTYPRGTWRLILSPPASGVWNMALDETLLVSVGKGESLPVLRLYSWEPPCLSLGYAQPNADVDQEHLAQKNWDLVRRPTGGKAILHTDELTYAVIASDIEPRLAGGVLESYQRISQALLYALKLLGIEAEAKAQPATNQKKSNEEKGNPVCFEAPSNYEIIAQGKKLIGSAQARRKEGVLQHGSLPLIGDITRIVEVLAFKDEQSRQAAAKRLINRATTVKNLLHKEIGLEDTMMAFVDAFRIVLNLKFETSAISPAEMARLNSLMINKYDTSTWTNRV